MGDSKINELQWRIIRHLLINAGHLPNISLYQGKLGISIAFYHLYASTKDEVFEQFAEDLLDDVCNSLHKDLPLAFDTGLCGIGYGITYLLYNGFVEGDPDDILSDIDAQIMERNIFRITDYSLKKGLGGIFCYASLRIQLSKTQQKGLPFDKMYIHSIRKVARQLLDSKEENIGHYAKVLLDTLEGNFSDMPLSLAGQIEAIDPIDEDMIVKYPLGLEKGHAGIVLNYSINML